MVGLVQRVQAVVDRVNRWKPVRVIQHHGRNRGPILASGLAFQALFAVFAALWVAFSIAGLVVSGDVVLRRSLLDVVGEAIPGLVDDGDGAGAIDPDTLLSAPAFSLSGAIALAGLLISALGWLAAARDAVREMFELPPLPRNFFLQKAIDLGLGLALAPLLLAAGALSFVGANATELLLDLLGIARDSVVGAVATRAVSVVVTVIVYAVALVGLYRVLAGVRIPWRLLRTGVLLGATGLAALTVAGTLLLGGARNNPLIASFAVVAGLLLYYNLACQVILVAASWMAVSAADAGVVLDERVAAERLEAARRLVAEHEPAPEPDRRPWWRRLLRPVPPRPRGDGGRR